MPKLLAPRRWCRTTRTTRIVFLAAFAAWIALQLRLMYTQNRHHQDSSVAGPSLVETRISSTENNAPATAGAHQHDWKEQPNAQQQQQAAFCLQHRGDAGTWQKDTGYAAAHQYKTFGNFPKSMIRNQRFVPTLQQAHMPSTEYSWKDATCETPLFSLEAYCQVCQYLNITRVYTAGDSLTEAFASSLRALAGYPKWASIQFIQRPWVLRCQDRTTVKWTVEHLYRRVQTENTDLQAFFRDDASSFLNKKHNSRRDFIADNPVGRTAVVINIGAHVHSVANFTASFDHFLQAMDDALSGKQAIVFFRNSVAGHKDCLPRVGTNPRLHNWTAPLMDAPYASFADYAPHATTDYDWNLMEAFNSHAARVLNKRHERQQHERALAIVDSKKTPTIRLLNIWNATILRKDGHVGFGDCLHYNLPGPTDWWVHFWFAALQDLAVLEQQGQQHDSRRTEYSAQEDAFLSERFSRLLN